MIKVAMIGAGSVVFSRTLTGDILSFPEFKNATFAYMDIDKERLAVGAALCAKTAKAFGARPKIETYTDRRKALAGADFVINMVQIDGFPGTLIDFEIPRKYGLRFTIADTTGPGGFFRALRTYPMLSGLCQDMQAMCPDAMLLNYSNPMSMNMQTIFNSASIRSVGLCHSVQGTLSQLAWYLGEDPAALSYTAAGINHMSFFLTLAKNGVDLYPKLYKAMEKKDVYDTNRVRFELMRRLGYFVTESSEHAAEYNSWFIPKGDETVQDYQIPLDEYLKRCDANNHEFERMKVFARSREKVTPHRSHEYGSQIIHSLVSGTPRVIYGNLLNNGAIANLPANAIVETPTLVDRSGLKLTTVGSLPPQLVGYMMPHIVQHELFIQAAAHGRRECVYQAAQSDPLTAAMLTPQKIVEMCDEMIAAHGKALPPLRASYRGPGSGKKITVESGAALQKRWDKAKKESIRDLIAEWHVAGPFPVGSGIRSRLLDVTTPVEKVMGADGDIDLRGTYSHGAKQLKWQKVAVNEQGHIVFDRIYGVVEWANAYGYAEVTTAKAADMLLMCGSDDGIKIWINGIVVHQKEVERGLRNDEDIVPVHLNAGRNRILVKIANHHAGWGFSLGLRSLS